MLHDETAGTDYQIGFVCEDALFLGQPLIPARHFAMEIVGMVDDRIRLYPTTKLCERRLRSASSIACIMRRVTTALLFSPSKALLKASFTSSGMEKFIVAMGAPIVEDFNNKI